MFVTANLQAVIHKKNVIFFLIDYPCFKFRFVDFSDIFVNATKPVAKENIRTKAMLLF
jgi:hypothetical protein